MLLVIPRLLLHFALDFSNICLLVLFFLDSLQLSHLVFEVLIVEPSDPFAVFPEPCAFDTVDVAINALTVLLAILPLTCILPTILPRVDAEAVLLIVEVLTFVHAAVLPREFTLTVHIAVGPVTLIRLAIFPFVDAYSINLIVLPISLVNGAIGVDVFAATVLSTLIILANIA